MTQNICKITSLDLSNVVPVKSTVEILQKNVAYSECMNFNILMLSYCFEYNNLTFRLQLLSQQKLKKILKDSV